MTREEAIAYFKDMNECTYGDVEPIQMAISALSQEPCDDAISRDWLKTAIHNFYYGLKHTPSEEDIQAYIDAAPPVTQKPIECDAISREDAIKALQNVVCESMAIKSRMIGAIEELPPVTQKSGKWIPVSERLPEVGISVLVSDADSDIYFTHITRDGVFFDEWGNKIKGIVAWMPLPEPYKVEPQESEE